MHRSKRTGLGEPRVALWFLLGLLLLVLRIKSTGNLYDEGLVLVNAERIRAGEVPYRDFWTLYAPGYFYAVAALFAVVEPTVLAARCLDVALRFLLALEVFFVARHMSSRRPALAAFVCVSFWLATIGFYSYPAFPATGAILSVALLVNRYLTRGTRRWLFFAGLALGLVTVLRLDFGAAAAAGFGAALALDPLPVTADAHPSRHGRPWRVLRVEAVFGAGALLVSMSVYLPLIIAAGVEAVYADLVQFPATVFRAFRRLPLPPLIPHLGSMTWSQWDDWLRLYLPVCVYIVAAVTAVRWVLLRPVRYEERRRTLSVLFVALTGTGLGLIFKATIRYQAVHMLPATICATILASALVIRLPVRFRRSTLCRVTSACLAVLVFGRPYIADFALATADRTLPGACSCSLPKSGCVAVAEDQEHVANYLRTHTGSDDYVFIGSVRHDMIFVNDLLLYFLADRRCPTKYAELHPGLATTLPVQQAIIRDLIDKDVRWVVLMSPVAAPEPNASSISSGVTQLDTYLRDVYGPVTQIGHYEVRHRRPAGQRGARPSTMIGSTGAVGDSLEWSER